MEPFDLMLNLDAVDVEDLSVTSEKKYESEFLFDYKVKILSNGSGLYMKGPEGRWKAKEEGVSIWGS